MADKSIIVEINYDTREGIKNINDLTAAIEGERVAQAKLKHELETGKISQTDYAVAVEESKNTMNKANTERKAAIQLLGSEKGSIDQLKAAIKEATIKRDALNQSTEEGRKLAQVYNEEIKAMKKSLGEATGETKGFIATLSNMPGPLGGIVSGLNGMVKAALAFIATPLGMVVTAIVLAFKALQTYLKGSEEGQNRLNRILNIGKAIFEALQNVVEDVGEAIYNAINKPKETIIALGNLIKENLINRFTAFGVIGKAIAKIFSGEFKQGFKDLADGALQLTTGVEGAINKVKSLAGGIKNAIAGINADIKNNLNMASKLSNLQADIDKRERAILVQRAKNDAEIAELRLKATEKDVYSQKERLAFLQKAAEKIDSFTKFEKELAKAKYDAAVLNQKITGDDKEALMAVSEAEANLINVKKNALDERRAIQKQISTLILNEGNDAEANAKKQETIDKEMFARKQRLADDEAELTKNLYDEIDQYAQESAANQAKADEESAATRGKALVELAKLKEQELINDSKKAEDKKAAEIAQADSEKQRAIDAATGTNEELELIEQEHKMRLTEIETEYQENIAEQRRVALETALSDLQQIIDASQGMGDARVAIASEAFAKLSTINWSEVKNAKDGFVAIGNAAKGLTSLITKGYDKQLANLETQKQYELSLVGDNADAKAAIEKDFANKKAEIQKKQAADDKKKAIIDAAIATALAVVNSLKAGVPIGLIFAAIAAAVGGIQIAAIASQPAPTFQTYAKGGIIGGKSHSEGGTKFYGEDGSMFEAERGEAMFVLKKDATAEIAALSAINESHGGRSWNGKQNSHLAEGGEAAGMQVDMRQAIIDGFAAVPAPVVMVGDIETGLTNTANVRKAGVIA